MTLTARQKRFLDFVKAQHGAQKRKYSGEPYWHHVYEVAEIVSEYEPKAVEIALGHDLLEDTTCTYRQLSSFLAANGYEWEEARFIADGVQELTDEFTKENHPDKNRKQRKQLEAQRLGRVSPLAQSVKYADLIHNMSSIVAEDRGFARQFSKEKRDILHYMRRGHIDLLIRCCHVLQEATSQLKND